MATQKADHPQFGYVNFASEDTSLTPQGPSQQGPQIPMGVPVCPNIKYVYPKQGQVIKYPEYPSIDQETTSRLPSVQAVPALAVPQSHVIQVTVPNYANGESKPTNIICPRCHQYVATKLDKRTGLPGYASCVVMSVFLPLSCFVPFLMDKCKDIRHYCPNCGYKVGKKYASCC